MRKLDDGIFFHLERSIFLEEMSSYLEEMSSYLTISEIYYFESVVASWALVLESELKIEINVHANLLNS